MSKKPDYFEPDNEYGYVRMPTMLSCAVDDTAITDSLLRYLVAIGSYSTRRNANWCWPSRHKIAQRMGVSPRAVTKAMATLADLGYIEIRPRFEFENETEEAKRGKQVSNYYRVLLDFELPPSRDRSLQARPRAGVGGRPKNSVADDVTPGTPAVPPPLELQSSTPPGTLAVPPPLELQSSTPPGTLEFQQNLESEYGNGNWKRRPANAGGVSPQKKSSHGENRPPETGGEAQFRGRDVPQDRGAALSLSIWLTQPENHALRMAPFAERRDAYDAWCAAQGLEPRR